MDMRLFFHLIFTIVINLWILYQRIEIGVTGMPMNHKKFRIDLSQITCQTSAEQMKRSRLSNSDPIESKKLMLYFNPESVGRTHKRYSSSI